MVQHTGRNMLIYLGLAGLMGLLFIRLPTSFLPVEDQGWMLVFVQAPVGATAIRTNSVLDKVQDHFLNDEKKTVAVRVHRAGLQFLRFRAERRHRVHPAQGLGASAKAPA